MRGGKRTGAGRKAIAPELKKVQMSIYVMAKNIDILGYERIRLVCDDAINKETKTKRDEKI